MARTKKLSVISIIISVIAVAYFLFGGVFEKENPFGNETPTISDKSSMTVQFLDVGQGDSTFIMLPDGKTALIDAANPGDGEKLVLYLKTKGVKNIDYLIATHPHADHIGGMKEIIEGFDIGQIFAPKIATSDLPTSKTYENFLTAVKDKGLKLTRAQGGNILFEGEGYKAECFSPLYETAEGLNNYSVVIKLHHGENKFLFMGDAEEISENQILDKGFDPECTVLKCGHHGSSTSNSPNFLKAASPKFAVISCGVGNSYGHPHWETLKALESLSGFEKLYRTDKDKTVTAISDGKGNVSFTVGGVSLISED